MTAYEQGFMDKCAELGVDPSAIVKRAQALGPGVKDTYLGDVVQRGVGKAKAYAGQKFRQGQTALQQTAPGAAVKRFSDRWNDRMSAVGDRIGQDYAAYKERTKPAPTYDQQIMRFKQQLGYQNRVLGNYRRAAGVPHKPIAMPTAPAPKAKTIPGIGVLNRLAPGSAIGAMLGR